MAKLNNTWDSHHYMYVSTLLSLCCKVSLLRSPDSNQHNPKDANEILFCLAHQIITTKVTLRVLSYYAMFSFWKLNCFLLIIRHSSFCWLKKRFKLEDARLENVKSLLIGEAGGRGSLVTTEANLVHIFTKSSHIFLISFMPN